ncbi:MAG: LPS export ABC transporter ATP-binding protein [Pseudomonadota bacterium]
MSLRVQDLIKTYGRRRVVDGVGMEVRPAEVVGLLGPNGAGKTTTFYMVVGLVRPDGGQVFLGGEDIGRLPMHERARRGISYLPQEASIFRKLTVRQNMLAVLESLPLSRHAREDRLNSLLAELGVAHLGGSYGYSLSGGERRRVEISRALAIDPAFMLLDEPFAGVDPLAVLDIQAIIRQLKDRGIGVLISDHSVRETLGVCDRAYILNEGRILEQGSPEEVANSERARRFYLGEKFKL